MKVSGSSAVMSQPVDSFRGAWQGHTRNKQQVLGDSSYTHNLCQMINYSVSGLQSGSGKWFLLKPVPKSWAFSPNTRFHSREEGSATAVHDWFTLAQHATDTKLSLLYPHWQAYLSKSHVLAGVCSPLQASCSMRSCGEMMGSQHNKGTQLITADCHCYAQGFNLTMVFVSAWCVIFF